MSWQDVGHNGDPMASFSESQQRVWRAAFHEDVGPQSGEATGSIKCLTSNEAVIEEEERLSLQCSDVHAFGFPKLKRRLVCGKKLDRRKQERLERMVIGLQGVHRTDPNVKFTALQHSQQSRAKRLGELDLHVRPSLGVTMQKRRKNPVDHLRRRRHLQDAGIGAPQQLSSLSERANGPEDSAAIAEQPLTLAGEDQPAANTIK